MLLQPVRFHGVNAPTQVFGRSLDLGYAGDQEQLPPTGNIFAVRHEDGSYSLTAQAGHCLICHNTSCLDFLCSEDSCFWLAGCAIQLFLSWLFLTSETGGFLLASLYLSCCLLSQRTKGYTCVLCAATFPVLLVKDACHFIGCVCCIAAWFYQTCGRCLVLLHFLSLF